MKLTLVSIFSIIILAGCSHHYMYREASLKSLPEIECIVSSIRDTPGVDKVHYLRVRQERELHFPDLRSQATFTIFATAEVLVVRRFLSSMKFTRISVL